MGFLSRIFGKNETRSAPHLPDTVGYFGGGGYNDSGVSVTELTALAASSVYACCKILAEAVAQLPVHIYLRDKGEKDYQHPVARLLAAEPNEFMTATSFREAMMLNLALYGNAYAFIDKDGAGVPVGLYPLNAGQTRPVRQGGMLFYSTRMGSSMVTLPADQVYHVLNFSVDGITGINPIQQAKQNIGLSIALERFAAKLFSNGGNVGGILKLPPMSEEALRKFVTSWRANYTGLDSAFKVAVLPDQYSFTQTTIDPEKAQSNAARVHQVLEVARIYRVPPHMLGVMDKASYASIEMQNMEFYQGTIAPYVIRLEQESNRKLLLEAEKTTHETRFNLDAMLRASTQERYAAYQTGRQAGFLSVNDIRRKENLPPVPGGDALLQPLNMTPVNAPAPALPEPKPTPPAPDPAATRSLLESTIRRFVTKERNAVARACKKYQGNADELRAWASEFYASHQQLVADALAPVLRAAGLTVEVDTIAKRHCAAAVAMIGDALKQKLTADELTDDIEQRATELADEIIGGSDNAIAA